MRQIRTKCLWLCLLFSAGLYAQQKTISGVVSNDFGETLFGANVIIDGTASGTLTDLDGGYTITANVGDNLVFSYVGHESKTITVGLASQIDIVLTTDALETVVITGYNNYRKDKVTAAVSVVAPKEIEQVPIASLDQVLQGRVAGLNVSTGSGQPGQQGTITIRGVNSFNGDSEPLFVIDGVFVDQDNFRSLNANDIDNVSVLKDASASALYGSRAAGGVIVVTTKRGNYNSPLSVRYRSQYGLSLKPDPNFDVLSSRQLLEYQRDINTGAGAGLTDAQIDELAAINTNWSDIFFRDGTNISHELSVSKGGDNSRSFTSVGYFEQEGITLGSNLQRFTFRSNNDLRSDRFSLNTNFTANFSKNDFIVDRARGGNTGGQLDNPFIVPYIGLPFQDAYNEDGSLNTFGTIASGALNADGSINASGANGFLNTPYLALNTATFNTDNEEELRLIGSIDAKLELFKNVRVGALFGADFRQQNGTIITTPGSIRGLITPNANSDLNGSRQENDIRDLRLNFNSSVRYKNTFADVHDVELSLFTEYNKRHFRSFGFVGFGLNPLFESSINGITNGQVVELQGGAETRPYIPIVFGSQNDRGLFSYFGVLRYGYDNKYDLQVSVRRDGSSFFPDENEFGTFYGVSGRWNISKENFLSKVSWLNTLALRASYGTVGNQELFIPFGQFSLFSPAIGYNSTPAVVPSAIGNNKLKWEETAQFNVGIDYSLFDERFTGTLDVYSNTTKDALLFRPVSLTSGFATFPDNVGKLRNKGVDLEFRYELIRNEAKEFFVSLFANANYNDNEILSLFDGEERVGNLGVGQSIGEFRLVRSAGVNPANGEPLYLDANGQITNQFNPDDAVFLGKSNQPKYAGGFGTDMQYKGFALSMLWSFAAEQYRTNGSLAVTEDPSLAGFANQSTTVLNAWKQPGDITDVPNPLLGGFRFQAGDRYLEDASFLRLRNIVLSYTLKGELFKKKPFDNARIYVQGQNALTFSRWRGFDPESNTGGSFFDFPTARTFTLGLDVNF
ncbi:MAG: SusC/RagA family TonB-linked outer membrane protein [Gilvibacter sp.]